MATSILKSLWGRVLGLDSYNNLSIPEGTIAPESGTATAVAGAATLSKMSGKITSESLTTAQGADYTLTLTNTRIKATDIVLATVANGTNSQGSPVIEKVTPANGSVVIIVQNAHSSAVAFNGTVVVSFVVIKQTTES